MKLNPARTPEWAKGMRKIGPGCYVDAANNMHVSEAEICEAFGVRYCPENSAIIEDVVRQVVREMYGDGPETRIVEAKPGR